PEPGRDGRGRFTKGNPGGPGNPFARRVAALRSLLLELVSDDDLRQVAQVLLEQAKQGDHAAVKLLFQYLLGKPSSPVDPDRLELDETPFSAQGASPAGHLAPLAPGVSAAAALAALRLVTPTLGQEHADFLLKGLATLPPADSPPQSDNPAQASQQPA